MRTLLLFCLIILVVSCREKSKPVETTQKDTVETTTTQVVPAENSEAKITELTKEILNAANTGNFSKFAGYIHPTAGVRFSPYGYIDTAKDLKFQKDAFLAAVKAKKPLLWGYYDGSGEEILLTPQAYFQKFVYDRMFLRPDKFSVNEMIGSGNSLNNLMEVYPETAFTESYTTGDKQHQDMDWRSLRLVFKRYGSDYFLVGVVQDRWTI